MLFSRNLIKPYDEGGEKLEIAEFIFSKLEALLFMGLLVVEVWFYFIVPGLRELKKDKKDEGRRK